MCDEGYTPQMLVIGGLVINRANIVATAFGAATDDKEAVLNILTTCFHDGDGGLAANRSISAAGRQRRCTTSSPPVGTT